MRSSHLEEALAQWERDKETDACFDSWFQLEEAQEAAYNLSVKKKVASVYATSSRRENPMEFFTSYFGSDADDDS